MSKDKFEECSRFAELLGWSSLNVVGWSPLKADRRTIPESRLSTQSGMIVEAYYCGDHEDIALQINILPTWRACVFAMHKYGICTEWHEFYPYRNEHKLRCEALRLEEYLARSWFTSAKKRRQFCSLHPGCCRWTEERVASTHLKVYRRK